MAKEFTLLDWGVIALYFLIVFIVGAISSKKQSGDRSFFLGNRSMPVWAVAISIVATCMSVVGFLGAPQEAFKGDLSYLILNCGCLIASFLIAFFFIPIFFRTNTLTIYGYLETRFGLKTRIGAGVAFLVGRLLASGSRLFAAALGASLLFNGTSYPDTGQLVLLIIVIGVAGTLYTISGGIKAVIWTDVIQFSVVVITVLVTIGFLMKAIPLSLSEMISTLGTTPSNQAGYSKLSIVHTGWNLASPYTLLTGTFAIVFLHVASYGVDHDLVQRMLTCKSSWRGGLSLIVSIVAGAVMSALFMCIGLLLYLFNEPSVMGDLAAHFNHSELIFPQFLITYLPTGLSGLAIAGLFAVAMGSLDSAINAMASSVLADVWRPMQRTILHKKSEEIQEGLKASRISVALVGVALMAFAILAAITYDPKNDTLLGFALSIMTYAYSGLLGVFLTGIFTKRGNATSALCSLVVGPIVVFLLQPSFIPTWLNTQIAWPWWMVFGTIVSFFTCSLGSPQVQESSAQLA